MPMGATDTSPQLVKLREAELICSVDDNGIGVGERYPDLIIAEQTKTWVYFRANNRA